MSSARLRGYQRGILTSSLALLLGCALLAGCFTRNFAEGYYVESNESGRWVAFDAQQTVGGETMRFFRLSLVQFDEEAAGVVELFELDSHEALEEQPLVVGDPLPNHFCTRLDSASTRNDRLTARFTDALNRRWELATTFEDDQLFGTLHRVDASGQTLTNAGDGLGYLYGEDQAFYSADATEVATLSQVRLQRERSEIDRSFLACAHYDERDEVELELPLDALQTRLGTDFGAQARLALLLTRPQRGVTSDALEAASIEEVLTATLEAVDLLEGTRSVLLRMPPSEDFMPSGVAIGVFVVYQDDPSSGAVGQWDNLISGSVEREPLLAYSRQRVMVFNASQAPPAVVARDVAGEALGTCTANNAVGGDCLFEADSQAGWSLHDFSASEELLPSGERTLLLRRVRGTPLQTTTLEAIDAACGLCYPIPDASCDPEACPVVLPLLYL